MSWQVTSKLKFQKHGFQLLLVWKHQATSAMTFDEDLFPHKSSGKSQILAACLAEGSGENAINSSLHKMGDGSSKKE